MQRNIRIGWKFVEIKFFRTWMIYKGRWRFKIEYAETLRCYYSYLNLFCFNLTEIWALFCRFLNLDPQNRKFLFFILWSFHYKFLQKRAWEAFRSLFEVLTRCICWDIHVFRWPLIFDNFRDVTVFSAASCVPLQITPWH